MEHDRVQEWLYGKAKEESEKWFIAQCANSFGYFYLYYTTGDIKISDSHPGEGWHLAMPQRISPAWSKEQAKTICVEALRRCPCLPMEVKAATE